MSRDPKFVAFVADLDARAPRSHPLALKMRRRAANLERQAAEVASLEERLALAGLKDVAEKYRLAWHVETLMGHVARLRAQADRL